MRSSRRPVARAEARFRELYESRPVVERVVRRGTRDRSHVEDLVHETFVVAWRRLPDVPAGSAAVGWLCGVARRVVLNADRSSRRRIALVERYAASAAEFVTVPSADAVDALAAWHRLPHGERSLLVSVGWDGAGRAELARLLGCTEEAAAMRLSRARRRLDNELAT